MIAEKLYKYAKQKFVHKYGYCKKYNGMMGNILFKNRRNFILENAGLFKQRICEDHFFFINYACNSLIQLI